MSYLSIVAAASLVSSMARFMPMQLRRPSEKGMKTSWSLHDTHIAIISLVYTPHNYSILL